MRCVVLGDLGLDIAVECTATKLASESPAIVFHEKSESYSLAMAANVAQACRALGVEVLLCGVVGKYDRAGRISDECIQQGIETNLIANGEYETTVKKRYFDVRDGQRRLVARFDRDCGYQCDTNDARFFLKRIQDFNPDAVIIQDHGKGVANRDLVNLITQEQWVTFIDPCKTTHLSVNSAVWVGGEDEFPCRDVLDMAIATIIKKGANGIECVKWHDSSSCFEMEAYCNRPVDSVGAGDQFIAALVVERLLGRSWKESCHVASIAAAIKCGRYGTMPVTYDEIHEYQIGTQWQRA